MLIYANRQIRCGSQALARSTASLQSDGWRCLCTICNILWTLHDSKCNLQSSLQWWWLIQLLLDCQVLVICRGMWMWLWVAEAFTSDVNQTSRTLWRPSSPVEFCHSCLADTRYCGRHIVGSVALPCSNRFTIGCIVSWARGISLAVWCFGRHIGWEKSGSPRGKY